MTRSKGPDIIRGGDPEDEIQPKITREQPVKPKTDWQKIYEQTNGAAALVTDNEKYGVTHD